MEKTDNSAGFFSRWIDPYWENPSWWNLLVIAPWFIGAMLLTYTAISNHIVAERQHTAEGIVTTHEAANHDQYRYSFTVDGQRYDGLGQTDKEKLEIGERVVVCYDPLNPSKNALKSFRTLSLENAGPVPTLLLAIGAVAWMIKSARKNRSESKS